MCLKMDGKMGRKAKTKTKTALILITAIFLSFHLGFGVTRLNLISSFAGSGNSGYDDGEDTKATFSMPYGLAAAVDGGIIVVDSNNSKIREIKDGKVLTLAGYSDKLDSYRFPMGGFGDGSALKARFNKPRYAAVDSNGVIYISDTGNNVIRKLYEGKVSTFAGNGKGGYQDGSAAEAMFNCPSGLVIDDKNNLYVADTLNQVIRKITPDGTVSTYAGTAAKGAGYQDGSVLSARFNEPSDLAMDKQHILYIVDSGNQLIRKTDGQTVATVCGSYSKEEGDDYALGGFLDGYGADAQFNFPKGIAVSDNGTLFVSDTWNNRIRGITKDGQVITVAGTGTAGVQNGRAETSMFNGPAGLLYHNKALYVADLWNNSIQKIDIDENQLSPVDTPSPTDGIQFYPRTENFQLVYAGKLRLLTKEHYHVRDGVVSVNLAAFAKALGYHVTWNAQAQVLRAVAGKRTYVIDGKTTAVQLEQGKPMMELKTAAGKLGYESYWVPERNGAVLYRSGQ